MTLPSAPQIRQAAQAALHRWAKDEASLSRAAFGHGGHTFHGGAQWPARKRFYPWPILLRTGALKNSIRAVVIGAGTDLHAAAQYASFHQYGTGQRFAVRAQRTLFPGFQRGTPGSLLPVRKIFDITPEDEARLVVEMQKDVEGLIASRSL